MSLVCSTPSKFSKDWRMKVPGNTHATSKQDEFSETAPPFPPEFARIVLKQIIDGLEYIHFRGIFHRDVKPANVLVFDKSLDAITVKLCDFSKSVLKPKDDQRPYPQEGTAAWAPPEVLSHHYNASSEAFGVGAILFYVMFAKEPFKIPQSHARATFEQQIRARKSRIDKVNMGDIKEPGNPHSAEELLRSLLKESCAERATLVSARNDPWMINNQLLDMLSYNDPLVADLLSRKHIETEQESMETSSVSDTESYQSTERDHVSENSSNQGGDEDDNEADSYQSTDRDVSDHSDEDHSEVKEHGANDQIPVHDGDDVEPYRGRHYNGDWHIPGNLVVSGNLVVRGDVLVTGNVKLNGDMDVVGDVDVQGKLDVGQDVIVDGEAIMKSSVDVRGRMRVRGVDVPNGIVARTASERGSSADAEGETDYDAESDGGAAIDEAGQDRPWTRSVTPQSDLSRDATVWPGDGVAAPVPDWGYVHDALAARSQVSEAEVDVRSEGTIVAGSSGLPHASLLDPLSRGSPQLVVTDVDMEEHYRCNHALGNISPKARSNTVRFMH
ncbi:kinase-like protein [Punctularia strigosozonata HHB-11173 SS5]|uniref:Kinase-like protein n=1 Tax=Punctularia strigosozonata (strain HHB-11173) TaxID=741275 RepID=R7S432_PUNST|nr:kinase-like protein [Punctularia strigosozonata HHB-11173 SS5]EIN04557.1 kinase-like protein [Punctularia strigosozonata HHB-11173 SS5]